MKVTLEQQKKGQELYKELVQKARESAMFKEQLVNNPKKVISEITGNSKFNDKVNIIVEDQTDTNTIYLNIPRKLDAGNLELTDEQLEMVSGGEFVIALAVGAAFLTGMGVGVAIYAAVKD